MKKIILGIFGLATFYGSSQDCIPNHDAYMNKYRHQETYVPSDVQGIKYIHLSFHIWQDGLGEGPWQETPETYAVFDQIIAWMNGWMSNSASPSDPYPGVSNVGDTRIRFVLDHSDVYFRQNTDVSNKSWASDIMNYMSNNHPETIGPTLQIHMVANYNGPGAGNSTGAHFQSDNYNEGIITGVGPGPDGGGYGMAQHLLHEVGHNWRLNHTYNGSWNQNEDWIDFLHDVYDASDNSCAPHDACQHVSNCDPHDAPDDYCTNNIMSGNAIIDYWISDLQAGRMHRISHLQSTRQYMWGYDPVPQEITESETWDFSFKTYKDIVVKAGAVLTVKCEIQFIPEAKIIVEPGGRLVLDGGTLTNAKWSNDFWQGVEIWGNHNQSQQTATQGQIVLQNDAKIENAHVGVKLWKAGDWATTGGIIRSTNSLFLNNNKDVEFMPYSDDFLGTHLENKSFFKNTEFIWDDDYMGLLPYSHVTLYLVDGVSFDGCTFADDRADPPYAYQNTGIRSFDAKYYVRGRCDAPGLTGCPQGHDDVNWDPTEFRRLYHGIDAGGSGADYPILVETSVFNNCKWGIQLNTVNSSEITQNTFNYTLVDNPFELEDMFGVHTIYSNDYRIEENEFIATSHTLAHNIGVLTSETGGTDEVIYKNHYENLVIGNYAQGRNRSIQHPSEFSGYQGLQYLCNEFVTNKYDIQVVGKMPNEPIMEINGVRKWNGSETSASGNAFSSGWPNVRHYLNESLNNVHYYHSSVAGEEPILITGITKELAPTNSCLSLIPEYPIGGLDGDGIAGLVESFVIWNVIVNDKTTELLTQLDGGDTDGLLDYVGTVNSRNRNAILDHLLGLSPFVSEDVVKTVVDQSNIDNFPHSFAVQLILANIDYARDPFFIDFLRTKTVPMPEENIGTIISSLEGAEYSVRYILEREIADASDKRSFYSSMIIRGEQQNAGANESNIRDWINLEDGELKGMRLVDLYLQEGDMVNAAAELTNLEELALSLPAALQDQVADFVSLKNAYISLVEDPQNVLDRSHPSYLIIEAIAAEGTGLGKYEAQGMLCFFFNECVEYIPERSRAPIFDEEEEIVENSIELNDLKLYPNPATDYFTIELPQADGAWTVVVRDIAGRVVLQETTSSVLYNVDTDQLIGSYFVEVFNSSERFNVKKVVIGN